MNFSMLLVCLSPHFHVLSLFSLLLCSDALLQRIPFSRSTEWFLVCQEACSERERTALRGTMGRALQEEKKEVFGEDEEGTCSESEN